MEQETPPRTVSAAIGLKALEYLSEHYSGHSAECKVEWYGYGDPHPVEMFSPVYILTGKTMKMAQQDRECISYLMFGWPPRYEHPRMVLKGSYDNIAVLLEPIGADFYCKLYDQVERTFISEGKVVRLTLKMVTADAKFCLDFTGLKKM